MCTSMVLVVLPTVTLFRVFIWAAVLFKRLCIQVRFLRATVLVWDDSAKSDRKIG